MIQRLRIQRERVLCSRFTNVLPSENISQGCGKKKDASVTVWHVNLNCTVQLCKSSLLTGSHVNCYGQPCATSFSFLSFSTLSPHSKTKSTVATFDFACESVHPTTTTFTSFSCFIPSVCLLPSIHNRGPLTLNKTA